MATNVRAPYTAAPWEANSVIFPTHGMQLLDNVVNYIGITTLTYCFARRSYHDDLLTIRGWASLTWARLTIILTFFTSWIFVFSSSILVNGVGLSYSITACRMGIYLCILFYAISKIFLYCFLAEKVHVVWATGKSRFRSPVYRLCVVVVGLYVGIFVLMIIGRISEFRSDGVCIIGLRTFSSVPLLSYDLFINIFLTFMFVFPLARSGFVNSRLRAVSARTLVAASVALTTSSINIAILTIMHGRQLGWVCLASCCTDVTANALVLFWVTSRGHSDATGKTAGPIMVVPTNLPNTPCDEDNTTWPRTLRTTVMFDPSLADQEPEHSIAEQRTSTRGTGGVRGWLHRMRSGNGTEKSSPVEVQVTVMTEMEMETRPRDHFVADGSMKSRSSLSASRDLEKEADAHAFRRT